MMINYLDLNNKKKEKGSLIMFAVLVSMHMLLIDAGALERRRSQFQNEFGYIVTPLPFILPGVGTGVGILGGLNNIVETPIDLYLVLITGDVEGGIIAIADIHLLPETVLLDLTAVDFNKGQQNRYLVRGMDSKPTDYNIVELSDSKLKGGRLIFTFFERMLEFYTISYIVSFKTSAVRDAEGELVNEIEDPDAIQFQSSTYGLNLDYTDDRSDPKRGIRLLMERSNSPPANSDAVDYFTMNYSLTGYVPMFSYSTLALNYFKSDAFVNRKGETDPELIKNDFGCFAATVDQCEQSVQEVIQSQVDQNTYGNSTALGGRSRLRSFVEGRFNAAHTEFFGAELRWNLTDENTPFDIWIMKDLRTGIQVAFFHEIGTVADEPEDLWKVSRSSSGVGARLVTGSGFIYRFDLAFGNEGTVSTLFIDYPWSAL